MAWYDDPANMAAVNDIMKEVLHPTIIDQINRECQIYSTLRRVTKGIKAKQWELANEIGHNEGIGFVAEHEELPKPYHQDFDRITLCPKALYGRMFITGHAMEKTGSDYGSLADALMAEMKGLVRDFTYEFGRIFFGNGRGILARCTAATNTGAAAAGVNIDIQDSWGIVSGDPRPVRLLRPHMEIASIDNAGAITGIGVVDAIVDADTITVTTPAAIGGIGDGANPCDLVRNNDDTAAVIGNTGWGELTTDCDEQREAYGLQNVANTNAFMGVDGATNAWWATYQADMAGATIDEEDIQEAMDEAEILSGSQPGYHITSHIIRRKIGAALAADRRFVNKTTFQGGWDAIEVCGKYLFADRFCPVDMYFGLNLDDIATWQTRDPFWIDEDGAILHRRENYHQFQAVMAYFFNLGAYRRNPHFRLYNADCT